jgi:hypothetical protein
MNDVSHEGVMINPEGSHEGVQRVTADGDPRCGLGSVFAALTLAGCGDLYDRKDFETYVKDKSEQEVRSKVGKPAAVDSSNPERVVWTYNVATFDSTNKNARDQKTLVVFKPLGRQAEGRGSLVPVVQSKLPGVAPRGLRRWQRRRASRARTAR